MRQRSKKKEEKRIFVFVLLGGLIILSILGLALGSVTMSLEEVMAVIFREDLTSHNAIIIWNVRLPRTIGGILAGIGLGTAGVLLQGVMNNSLASPSTIGVNSGAGFFVMISMVLMPDNIFVRPIFAFVGAVVTAFLVLSLAYIAGKSRATIILAGITISSILSAAMNMLKLLNDDISLDTRQFMVGSLSGITMNSIKYPAIGILAAFGLTIILSKALDILSLGDGVANSLGLNSNFYRIIFVFIASLLAGFTVSFAGLIGFVGLIVPHICRQLFGNEARILIPAAALLGADMVLFSDIISRILFAPYELPVGIILSIAGGIFFLYLLMRKGGKRVSA